MKNNIKLNLQKLFSNTPLIAWLTGLLVAALIEQALGDLAAMILGLPKIPVMFGFMIMLKKPALILSAFLYVFFIYAIPTIITARLSRNAANKIAAKLFKFQTISVFIHLAILYIILHIWSDISEYRELTVKLTMIAIIFTLSLNVINGYMGEFSCSHPGFMALGAYTSSVLTLYLFTNDKIFGHAAFIFGIGPFLFPLCLIAGGIVAAIGALAIAIPSFKTRGDYLAIISLSFMFIVKSVVENLEFIGGPRGLGNQPDYSTLPTVFVWTALCVWIINNFVRSTLGKALNAVRDDEIAADAMTVNTKKTKITAFMFSAFWAGVAGGLFAHVIRYINPNTFGLQRLAEMLAMVYLGGLNSVYGSILGAVSLSILGEALRPLELFKWIVIPLLLILVMIFRPTGLIAFKEFDVKDLIKPKGGADARS